MCHTSILMIVSNDTAISATNDNDIIYWIIWAVSKGYESSSLVLIALSRLSVVERERERMDLGVGCLVMNRIPLVGLMPGFVSRQCLLFWGIRAP